MNRNILAGAAAYTLWGLFPIYLKLLKGAPPLQIAAHRVAWSFGLLLILASLLRALPILKETLSSTQWSQTMPVYLGLSALLAANWLIFIWAVTSEHALEASLGYFINPLVNVILGMAFLGERLRRWQGAAVGLAAAGVLYLAIYDANPPWVALALAITFGVYGLLKKRSPLPALPGLVLETALILPPALAYLGWAAANGSAAFGSAGLPTDLLLAGLGAATAAPLLLFAVAARQVPLSTLGLLQYISPTIQFFNGVLLFGEPFDPTRAAGFGLIWLALAVFSLEGYTQGLRNADGRR